MAEEKKIFNVKGMHCEGCETRVNNVLSQVSGITDVKADHSEGKVELQLSEDVSDKEIRKKIKKLGFKVIRGGGQS